MPRSPLLALTLALLLVTPSTGCGGDPPLLPDNPDASIAATKVNVTLAAPLDSRAAYRLVVLFRKFSSSRQAFQVAYDAPFSAGSTSIELAEPKAPQETELLCARGPNGRSLEGGCSPSTPFHVAVGYIMLFEDGNRNGRVDFELDTDGSAKAPVAPDAVVLVAQGALIYDPKGDSVLPDRGRLPSLIAGPTPKGFSIYESYRINDSRDDGLRPLTGPLTFEKDPPNLF